MRCALKQTGLWGVVTGEDACPEVDIDAPPKIKEATEELAFEWMERDRAACRLIVENLSPFYHHGNRTPIRKEALG